MHDRLWQVCVRFGNAYVTSERTCLVMWRRQYSVVNVKRTHKAGQRISCLRDKSKLKDVRVEIFNFNFFLKNLPLKGAYQTLCWKFG